MNWRSSRLFLLLVLILVAFLVGIVLIVVHAHTNASPQITVIWQSSNVSFTKQEQQNIQTSLKSALVASDVNRLIGYEFTIIDAQRQGDWADFSANVRVIHETGPIATEPFFFLAHSQGTTWDIWLPGSSGFCNELKQTPNTLLDPVDKQYFRGCYQ